MRLDHVHAYNTAAAAFREATRAYLDALDAERARAEKALHFAGLIAATEVLGAPSLVPADGTDTLKLAMERADMAEREEAA